MKNKEKYAIDIVDCYLNNVSFAFDKKHNRLCECHEIGCQDCAFDGKVPCDKARCDWANAEYKESKYKEPKIFTEREKAFIRLFPEIKYIARDKWGKLFAYKDKPEKYEDREEWFNCDDPDSFYEIHFWGLEFNSIKWEDEEPTSRKEILGE